MTLSHTFQAAGAGPAMVARPGETIQAALTVGGGDTFKGNVHLELSRNGGATWIPARTVTGALIAFVESDGTGLTGAAFAGVVKNEDSKSHLYRWVVSVFDEGTDDLVADLTAVALDVLGVLMRDDRGEPVLVRRDDGAVVALPTLALPASVLDLASEDPVTTNGDTATALRLDTYHTRVTTGASEGSEALTIGDGTGVTVGQRKLVTLQTRAHASDVVALDHANIVNAAGAALDAAELDAEGEFVLLEWNGAKWQVVWANATLTAS